MVMILTADEILRKGLDLCGFNWHRQQNVKRATNSGKIPLHANEMKPGTSTFSDRNLLTSNMSAFEIAYEISSITSLRRRIVLLLRVLHLLTIDESTPRKCTIIAVNHMGRVGSGTASSTRHGRKEAQKHEAD